MEYDRLLCPERVMVYHGQKTAVNTDNRTEFEKDYHRIIGSASFRRLQDKTQVFALDKSDFVRTRLTHSLEVSSLAKSLGQSAGNTLCNKGMITPQQARDMSDILLCAGLIHDIGNPPFGHFGETVIRDWYRKNLPLLTCKGRALTEWLEEEQIRDMYSFEGNAQSLRVVAKLHHLVNDHGMNLTLGVLNTIIKYPVSSLGIDKKSGDIRTKKMGYFMADEALFRRITEGTGAGDRRYPLTFLLEAADDIAYSTADIEDGFKKGILGFSKLRELIAAGIEGFEKAGGDEEKLKDCRYALKRLDDLYGRAVNNREYDPESYAVQNWVISMQSVLIRSACDSFILHQDEILSGRYGCDLFCETGSHYLIKLLKDISFENIFQISSILRTEISAGNIIGSLMDQLVPAAILYDTEEKREAVQEKLMKIVSPNYLRHYQIRARELPEGDRLYLRLVLVNDFISGMTDSYAKSLYQELSGMV